MLSVSRAELVILVEATQYSAHNFFQRWQHETTSYIGVARPELFCLSTLCAQREDCML